MIAEVKDKINIDILEENDKIECSVKIVPIGRLCRTKIRLNIKNIFKFLEESGYKNLELVQGPTVIHNYVSGQPSSGTWTFKKRTPTKKRTTKSRTKASSKQ